MKQKKCAIFTIVKDEKFFLPIWLRYYKQYFSNSDIYILNHQSSDGSTDDLDVNVVDIYNDVAFDHLWLVYTVQNFQRKLLETYNVVIFAEIDEILYSLNQNFNTFIDEFNLSGDDFITCFGYEIIQNIDTEKFISNQDNIMSNRNFWLHNDHYDKTLVSKIPLDWSVGFHNCNYEKKFKNLYMVHLHRVDFNMMLERNHLRATKFNLKKDDLKKGWGWQHSIGDKSGVLSLFNQNSQNISSIPTEHKNSIVGL